MAGRGHVAVSADLEALGQAAAAYVAERSAEAVAARGRFTVALSGGSTPPWLYRALVAPPWSERVDWLRWHVFLGDERLVPADDERSNVGLARRELLDHVPVPRDQVYPPPVEAGAPDAVARAYEARLRAVFARLAAPVPRFDLILLGLGSDGHTASLFPGMPALEVRDRLVVASPPGSLPPPVDRVTFTLPLLDAARAVLFLVAGQDKAATVRRVLDGDADLPASRVRPRDGDLRWLLDRQAAADLATTA